MSRRSFRVNKTAHQFARGFLCPNIRLEENFKPRIVVETEPISRCYIRAFRVCIGRSLIKAGLAVTDKSLPVAVPAIEKIAFRPNENKPGSQPKRVKIEKIKILDPPAGREPERIIITIKFIKRPRGLPRSGQYIGTLADFRRHCVKSMKLWPRRPAK